MSRLAVTLLALVATIGPLAAGSATERDASARLTGLDGTFVVLNAAGDRMRHNPERAARRFVPASTFKIANALIALETGVASGADFEIPWDGKRPDGGFWARSWSRDHTLRSAMQNGVLWYYQEIARRVGAERMARFVDDFDYGNERTTGPIDRFWLDGPLEISADEQVKFLRRFREKSLGLSERTTRIAREILVLEEGDGFRLSGKTGSAPGRDGRWIAWFVGYVESGGQTHDFALNLDCAEFADCDHLMRRRVAREILVDWEILPPGS